MEARVLPKPVDPWDDPDAYPCHEEDDVPEIVLHHCVGTYFDNVLSARLRHGWVTGNVCCYWIRADKTRYLVPDVFVVEGEPPDPLPSSYLSWVHGPMRLAIEIASETSQAYDAGEKRDRYAEGLRPREYLYLDPASGDLRLSRWTGTGYVEVPADARGWVWSEEAQLWFGGDPETVFRAYDRESRPMRSRVEEAQEREAAEERARAEAKRRVEAERAAQVELERRVEAERRLAELQAELERLRERNAGAG
jgi:Uma2 family endonuclease